MDLANPSGAKSADKFRGYFKQHVRTESTGVFATLEVKTMNSKQIHINGQLRNWRPFEHGIYVYTHDYWDSLPKHRQDELVKRFPQIRAFFEGD